LSICDNGGGIKINPNERVFETFVSDKEDGHGIGLAMCKVLVENKLQGNIKAFNQANGACFEIRIKNSL